MRVTELSTSVSLIEGATTQDLRVKEAEYRAEYIRACENSSDARVPSQEDMDLWWPLTASANAP